MKSAYYNENDTFAAAWLRELIKANLIADGEVDERSIKEVTATDVRGFRQCHFFAGIGGWSYALRLAGWPDDRIAWTGSCPCQPFSSAGKADGANDSRHLWPAWFRLIGECGPVVVFGEQVASADGLGWFDCVSTDLEGAGYAVGAADLCAASVGAFHIRQRLYFVADANDQQEQLGNAGGSRAGMATPRYGCDGSGGSRAFGELADASGERFQERERDGRLQREAMGAHERQAAECRSHMGDAHSEREATARDIPKGPIVERGGSPWAGAEWIACRDGKARPVEPGTFPLAHGVSARVGRLRGYGNAIVPQVAQAFIEAYCEARGLTL